MTFVGQFIDHDLTFDATSSSASPPTRPGRRTAAPPRARPRLACTAAARCPARALRPRATRSSSCWSRAASSRTCPGAPTTRRSSATRATTSNLIISGLHARVPPGSTTTRSTRVAAAGPDADRNLRRRPPAHDLALPVAGASTSSCRNFVGQALVDDVLHGTAPRYFRPRRPGRSCRSSSGAPRTASGTAWCGRRTGRTSRATAAQPFFGLIFDSRVEVPDGQNPTSDPGDLRGGFRAAAALHRLADLLRLRRRAHGRRPAEQADRHRALDAALRPAARARSRTCRDPGRSPCPSAPCCGTSPGRCPPGQAIARAHGRRVAAAADLSDLAGYGHGLDRSTPLWLYVLREASW